MRNCVEDGCDRPSRGRGRCGKHYLAWRINRPGGPPCQVEGCGKPTIAKGLCSTHYAHQRLYGTPHRKHPPFDRQAQRLVLKHLRSGMSLREAAEAAGCNPDPWSR